MQAAFFRLELFHRKGLPHSVLELTFHHAVPGMFKAFKLDRRDKGTIGTTLNGSILSRKGRNSNGHKGQDNMFY